MSDQEQKVLDLHRENSQDFYNRGAYDQALQQADKALSLKSDLPSMQLIRGFCLVKLGAARQSARMLDEAVSVMEQVVDHQGDDFRVWLGAGQAHLARALQHGREMAKIERRLAGDFLDAEGREREAEWLERERSGRRAHLERAEETLQQVLDFELGQDNAYALIDLVLVLNTAGGREDEALQHARRAVVLLIESTRTTRNTLQRMPALSASEKLRLQGRIDDNLAKERQLRDIIVTIERGRGALQACLDELDALESRQLMTANQRYDRAEIYERLGMYEQAVVDFEEYLRLRSRTSSYDDMASLVFQRIEELRSRSAGASSR